MKLIDLLYVLDGYTNVEIYDEDDNDMLEYYKEGYPDIEVWQLREQIVVSKDKNDKEFRNRKVDRVYYEFGAFYIELI